MEFLLVEGNGNNAGKVSFAHTTTDINAAGDTVIADSSTRMPQLPAALVNGSSMSIHHSLISTLLAADSQCQRQSRGPPYGLLCRAQQLIALFVFSDFFFEKVTNRRVILILLFQGLRFYRVFRLWSRYKGRAIEFMIGLISRLHTVTYFDTDKNAAIK